MIQSANVSAQEEHQRRQSELNTELAEKAALNQYGQLQTRRSEEAEAAAQEIRNISSEARRARSSATVAAGEAGVVGNSVEALIDDFEQSELELQQAVLRNEFFRERQFNHDTRAVRNRLRGRIAAAQPRPVRQPDFIGGIANTLGDAVRIFGLEPRNP